MSTGIPITPLTVRRVVTSIGADGKPIVLSDGTPKVLTEAGEISWTDMWATPSPPPRVGETLEEVAPARVGMELPHPLGSSARVAALAPDAEDFDVTAKMHSTRSVDYMLVLSGELTAVYEGDLEVKLVPGDLMIQRGLVHGWRNRGTVPAVFFAVRVGALDHGDADGGWRPSS